MMRLSPCGFDFICRFEGFFPHIYTCPAGAPTIGYGHVLQPGEAERFAFGITEAQAQDLLALEVKTAEHAIAAAVCVPLTQNQFDALVSLVFNIGCGAFRRSTLLKKINTNDTAALPAEFMRWVKGGGNPLPGLERRRRAEADLFMQT